MRSWMGATTAFASVVRTVNAFWSQRPPSAMSPRREPGDLQELMQPYPADRLFAEPVSTRVNRPENDDALCLTPTEPQQGRLF